MKCNVNCEKNTEFTTCFVHRPSKCDPAHSPNTSLYYYALLSALWLHWPFLSWKLAGSSPTWPLYMSLLSRKLFHSFISFKKYLLRAKYITSAGDMLRNQTRSFHMQGACIILPFPSSFFQENSSMSFRCQLNHFFLTEVFSNLLLDQFPH